MTAPATIKWSEASIIQALALAFQWWRRTCCPNVQEGSEADFMLLTESDMLWECEVKISMADWKADLQKRRHYHPGWSPARFYYAVPRALVANGIPEWVPAHAGVLVLGHREDAPWARAAGLPVIPAGPSVVRWLRQAKPLHRAKAPAHVRDELRRKVYFRYWRHVAPAVAADSPATIEVPQTPAKDTPAPGAPTSAPTPTA